MAFLIVIILISLRSMPTSMVDASWEVVENSSFKAQEEMHFTVKSGDSKESKMGKVSGQDESEEKEALMLDKFRVLLGLGSLHKRKPHHGAKEYGSPAPAPAPIEMEVKAPAPAPVMQPIPSHPHRRSPRLSITLPHHKFHGHKEKQRTKRILIATLVSVGAILVIFTLGFVCLVKKFYKRRKRCTRTVSIHSSEGRCIRERGKDIISQDTGGNKVNTDPGFDLFYLNTLTSVLEPQTHLKGSSDPANTSAIQNSSSGTVHKKEDQDQEAIESGVRESSSSGDEIIHVHEYEQSIKYHMSDGHNSSAGDQISKIESHSSGDESFHSLCESNISNNARLSNDSTSSFSDAAEGFSPKVSSFKQNPLTAQPSISSLPLNSPSSSPKHPQIEDQRTQSIRNSTNCKEGSKHPPPPPPPPSYAIHSSGLAQVKAKSPSSVLQNTPTNESPGSSSRSNETPRSDIPTSPSTPNPQKPPSKIPPPPCPPLFMKGNSLKGPPPPPQPQTPDYATLGKDGAPLPKLKPLHWDKVRATPDRSMVWDKLRSSSFELDEEMIESLFGYSLKSAFQNDEGKSKTPSPGKHVLEPKRLQNMTILSKALNVTAEQVCDALIQGDGLRLQQLEALAKMEPTKEEEAKLSNYKGDINDLGLAEKLVRAMLNIPFAFQRIEAMLYRATFEDEVFHLRNSFSMLEEACKELRSNRLFLKLLEAVLKTGNRMNVGTIRGGAKAFKLDALLKLADVKGTDGKTTLLHFVVQEIIRSEGIRMAGSIMGKINQNSKSRTAEEKEEDYKRMGLDLVSGLSTELYNVKKTASIDLDVLATSVSNLSDGMAKLQKLAFKDLSYDATSSNFISTMKTFVNLAENNLRDLQEHEDKVLRSVKEITEYFHGDVGKGEANLLQIFIIVRDFLAMLDQVCRELKSLKAPKSPNPLAPFH